MMLEKKMTKLTSIKKRRKQAREEIIEDILSIARTMMQQDGAGALSFNAIARELGIRPPSLYTYFDSKNSIYDALFRRGFEMMDAMMDQVKGDTFDEQLVNIFRIYMTFAYENPDLFQIMFQRPIPDFVPSDESMAVSLQSLAKAREHLRDICQLQEIDPKMPIEQALDLIIAMMHGLASLHLANHPDLPVGEGRFGQVIDHASQLFLQAWKTNTNDKE